MFGIFPDCVYSVRGSLRTASEYISSQGLSEKRNKHAGENIHCSMLGQLSYPGLARVGVHTLLPSSLTPGLPELTYTLPSSPAHLPRACQSWCTHYPPPQLTYPGLARVDIHTTLLPSSLTPGLPELVYTLPSSPAILPRACQSWCTHYPPPQLTYPGLARVGVHTTLLPSSLTPGSPELACTLSSSPAWKVGFEAPPVSAARDG